MRTVHAGLLGLATAVISVPSLAASRTDVEFLCSELPERHVELFHTMPESEFAQRCASLAGEVAGLDDAAAVVAIAELVASVRDGHTRLTLPLERQAGLFPAHTPTDPSRVAPFHQLPIRLEALADGYIVVRASRDHQALLGARVEGIG